MVHLLSPVAVEHWNRERGYRSDRRWRKREVPAQNRLLEGVRDWSRLDTCWEWVLGTTSKGYGKLRFDGRIWLASRLAYQTWVRPLPAHMKVRHRCDNPRCINPFHLLMGTQRDNMRDRRTPPRDRVEHLRHIHVDAR